jgi:hypothetical protein
MSYQPFEIYFLIGNAFIKKIDNLNRSIFKAANNIKHRLVIHKLTT